MGSQINFQKGIFNTTGYYQTSCSLKDTGNSLNNAISRCGYKIILQTPNKIIFKTPINFMDWGFKITATISEKGSGSVVKMKGVSLFPLYIDILGVCKKRIAALETYL